MFDEILKNVALRHPVVHCITNYVTVNDCANVLLACGASPIMADDEAEAELNRSYAEDSVEEFRNLLREWTKGQLR